MHKFHYFLLNVVTAQRNTRILQIFKHRRIELEDKNNLILQDLQIITNLPEDNPKLMKEISDTPCNHILSLVMTSTSLFIFFITT